MRSAVFWPLTAFIIAALVVLLYPLVERLVKWHGHYYVIGHVQGPLLLLLALVVVAIWYSARRL